VSRRRDNEMTARLDESPDGDVLLVSLEAAVPLWIAQLRAMTSELRTRTCTVWAQQSAEAVASRGDQLMFRSKPHKGEGGTADTFNHLARGLAVGAFQPGGITFAGRHWEVTADDLVAARVATVVVETDCEDCGGSGTEWEMVPLPTLPGDAEGWRETDRPCPTCGGTGDGPPRERPLRWWERPIVDAVRSL
jgi:hypothetical protein